MKPRSKQELLELLSQYVDGELTEREATELREYVATDPEAAKELRELEAMKKLLTARKRVPESLGFWTRLSAELDRRKKEKESLLPFSRGYLPLVYGTAAVAVVLVGILLIQQRSSVMDYVSRQSEAVQKAVEENVLRGSLFPVLGNIDNNQALQFALFGGIPLDKKNETALRVDESADRGYRIDFGKKAVQKIPKVTVSEFMKEVKPTPREREVIDSVLDIGRRHLESSVLLSEDRGMAIDANLLRLNKVMLSGIAACLEPPQRVRFERFLKAKQAPYMVAARAATPAERDRIIREVRGVHGSNRMIVVTPDTLVMSEMRLDLDSLRRHFRAVAELMPNVSVRFEGLVRRIAGRESAGRRHVSVRTGPLVVVGDSEAFTIQFDRVFEEMMPSVREQWIQPRMPVRVEGPGRPRQRSFNFNMDFDGADSSFFFSLDLDSLMMRIQKEGPEAAFEFRFGDPDARSRALEARKMWSREQMDSVTRAERKSRAKLDSLIKVMQERELRDRQ